MSKGRIILFWIAVVFLSFSLTATWTFAKGKHRGKGSGTHSGWDNGKKSGWETDVSPGFEKKDPEWNEEGEKLQEMKQERKRKQQRSGEEEHHRKRLREGKASEKQDNSS